MKPKHTCTHHELTGTGSSARIHFYHRSPTPPHLKTIEHVQIEQGYHPHGYGYPDNVRLHPQPDNTFITTWTCSASCD